MVFLLAGSYGATRAQTGDAPATSFGARDVFTEFRLPMLKDQPHDDLRVNLQKTQVLMRAARLGVSSQSATASWRKGEVNFAKAQATVEMTNTSAPVVFNGTSASELNVLLANPSVTRVDDISSRLTLDVPLRIARDNITLNLREVDLRAETNLPYMIRIEDARNVRLLGGHLREGQSGVLVLQSQSVVVRGMQFDGLSAGGMVLSSCRICVIWENSFRHLGGAPLLLHGDTIETVVSHNTISENSNPSNWRAGIVITDRNSNLQADPDSLLNPDRFGVKEDPLKNRTHIPHDNVIAFNEILNNQSSGIYSDGGARNVFAGNRIEGNSKEGLCLDNGSLGNVLVYNRIQSNGKRWGKTDLQLKQEFVLNFGRLPDGSSPAKVPGVSLDNAAYNLVVFNEIDGNYGGGVKLVRTAFYNVIGINILTDNNRGRSDRFHFFGIEFGSAQADVPVVDLDFAPSRGNIAFGNVIRGNHYAGIFFADGSDRNDIFDNSIFGATNWAMESVRVQHNNTLNNFSNLPSRNVGPGLDPRLGEYSAGRFDKP